MVNSTSEGSPCRLTSQNLIRLGRGASLTPTASTRSETFLSSNASSSCLRLETRIENTRKMVRFYMERLLALKPEGMQIVLGDEVRIHGRDKVCLKADVPRPRIPWDNGMEVLGFWKRKRHFFMEQLAQIRSERFGTLPLSLQLSDLPSKQHSSVTWVDHRPVLREDVERWLRNMPPGKSYTPLYSHYLTHW